MSFETQTSASSKEATFSFLADTTPEDAVNEQGTGESVMADMEDLEASLFSPIRVINLENIYGKRSAYCMETVLSPSSLADATSPENVSAKKPKTDVIYTLPFEEMTVLELKNECSKYGLDFSGNKADLLERLQQTKREEKSRREQDYTESQVFAALKSLGYDKPKDLSFCAMSAIQNGFVLLEDGLDQVLATWNCMQCNKKVCATLHNCLNQPDYAGLDFEDGNKKGALQCVDCGIGQYVSTMCSGSFEVTSGQFHNHCSECSGFGKCLGDYREIHCCLCNGHYFTGLSSFPSPCTDREDEMAGMICGMAPGYTSCAWIGDHDDIFDDTTSPCFESP